MAAKEVAEKKTVAKLIRGQTYIYKNKFFKRGEEVPVDDALASELEELVMISRDSRSGDPIEKNRFRVTRASDDDDEDEEETAPARKPLKRGKPSRSSRL